MSKWVVAVMTAAFVGALGTPAMADCSADIAKVEPEIAKVSDATKKAKAEKELNEAKEYAKKKNERLQAQQTPERHREASPSPVRHNTAPLVLLDLSATPAVLLTARRQR
jgi:hypothetical protein